LAIFIAFLQTLHPTVRWFLFTLALSNPFSDRVAARFESFPMIFTLD